MAVGIQKQLHLKISNWDLASSTTAPLKSPESMLANMSYQYPLPPLDPIADVSPSTMVTNFHLSDPQSQSQSQSFVKPNSPTKNRGALISAKSAKIKRTMSTPNVRSSTSADAAALALSAEKRRNKLGYHRTSVACGKCNSAIFFWKAIVLCKVRRTNFLVQDTVDGERSGAFLHQQILKAAVRIALG